MADSYPHEITERFAHHPPTSQTVIKTHERVRYDFEELAVTMHEILPASREASLCQTALQEAAMWANAAIAIHMNKIPEDDSAAG